MRMGKYIVRDGQYVHVDDLRCERIINLVGACAMIALAMVAYLFG